VWIKASLVGAIGLALVAEAAAQAPSRAERSRTLRQERAGDRFTALRRDPCFTARKKLWLDGEGWVVRRVPVCR
jgi:hypothetical protein